LQNPPFPNNCRPTTPLSPARATVLREHIWVTVAAAAAGMEEQLPAVSHSATDPDPVLAEICSLCRGHCCLNGGDTAYIEMGTLQRVLSTRPDLDSDALLGLYILSLPERVFEGSCIYHGKNGCALDRDLRSDLCNRFWCSDIDRRRAAYENRSE
jgi:hypothetical protein